MTASSARRAALAVLLALAACAGPGGSARRAIDELVVRGEGAQAGSRAAALVRRDPRDPWARLAGALAARRALDGASETAHLLAIVEAAPGGPLSPVALRRLAELCDDAPELARAVEAGLAPLVDRRRVAGLAAYRARVARIAAAEVLGQHDRAAALRRENGAVTAWTLAGPFAVRRTLDFDRSFPPDAGEIPASVPGPLGLPARESRTIPVPDGTLVLDGEPSDGDVFYLAADATIARGGRYLVALGTSMSVRLLVDGAPIHERRAFAAHLPTLVILPVSLGPGRHRILVKAARASGPSALHVALSRDDGAPSDASFAPAPPGPPPVAAGRRPAAPAPSSTRELAGSLAPSAGPALAKLLAARDGEVQDRETAKALLAEAGSLLPRSAAVRVVRAEVLAADPTLDPQIAASRAEGELRAALARDPANPEARVALASLLRGASRLDEADEVVSGLEPAAAVRPAALVERARLADARGLAERAEALVAEALRSGGGCAALDLGRDLAARRGAVALEDERARAFAECRDGRSRLAEYLRRRGDARGAVLALGPLVRARPWDVEPAFALAESLVAEGELGRAADALEALRSVWPRSARILKRLADVRELSGDARAARAARERSLLLDGSDLKLRRALALEEGREVLDDLAEDAASAIRSYEAARRTDDTSSAMVLDASAVQIHPGGSGTERTHQIVHVLDQQGVEQYGEVDLPSGAEIVAMRTLKPDGRRLEPERAGADKGSVSLAGLEPGDYVQIEYLRSFRGDGEGVAASPFYFRVQGSRLFLSTYTVAAPAGLGLEADAHGMAAPRASREGVRDVVRAVARDVPAFVPEPSSPPATEILPFVHVGVGGGLDSLRLALADAFADRARPTEEIRALAREIRTSAGAGAKPPALARAAWARVAREVLGQGGSFADEASVSLSRGRGGRLTVLKAVLAELGIRARIALVRPFGSDPGPWRFPRHGLYSYPMLRVEAGGETTWHDPSLRVAPFGTIPSQVLDCEAIVLAEPGLPGEVVRTPSASDERREIVVRVTLEPDGSATVEGHDRYHGAAGAAAKGAVEQLDANERRQVVEGMLARSFRGITLTETSMLGEDDPAAPFTVRFRGKVPRLARRDGAALVLDEPILPERLGPRLVQVAARSTPLLVPVPQRALARIEISAPAGLAAVARPARKLETPFGSLERIERTSGRTLVREDRFELRRGRIAPGRYAELASFAAAVDAIQESPTEFRPDPGSAVTPHVSSGKVP